MKKTQAYRDIEDVRLSDENSFIYSSRDRVHAAYLSDRLELFARSYHQYIALRSGDAVLLGPIRQIARDRHWTSVEQWTDEDFAPVAEALDAMFRGWDG